MLWPRVVVWTGAVPAAVWRCLRTTDQVQATICLGQFLGPRFRFLFIRLREMEVTLYSCGSSLHFSKGRACCRPAQVWCFHSVKVNVCSIRDTGKHSFDES